MGKIFLVRHGLTEYNKSLRLQGSSDIPLNEAGLLQAKKASEFLKVEKFDAILSSPLSRAYATAEIINEHHDLKIHKMDELKEQYFGQFEGEHIENIRLKYPEGDIPGVETFDSLAERASKVMKFIEDNHVDQNVLVTAHSRTIKSILSLYTDEIHMVFTKLDNCSLSIIESDDNVWKVVDYNISTLS